LRALHRTYPLGARDYFAASDFRLAITTVIANVMLFDRDERGLLALKNCEQMLAEPGNVIVMFPEGTRSIDGRVARFRRGIGVLLVGTPHPVVPCHLDGTFRAWPKGALIPRPTRVRLAIGKARTYERVEPNETGVLDVCSDLRAAVLALAPEPLPCTATPNQQGAYR
jgi:1-acyl-sn-glycerol-3-phosphate acyltransferase